MVEYAGAELDRVMRGEAVRPPRKDDHGGESDPFRAYSRRTIRRLTGAGYLRRGALGHDEAADRIAELVPEVRSPDDAIGWYIRMALQAITESRQERNRRVYRRRRGRALALGYESFWDQRKALNHLRKIT